MIGLMSLDRENEERLRDGGKGESCEGEGVELSGEAGGGEQRIGGRKRIRQESSRRFALWQLYANPRFANVINFLF